MDARRVCQKVGLPLYTLNFSEVFKKEVVDNFLKEYEKGRTPNPCIRCNKLVKLGLLVERAKKLGFDYVASGHYACIKKTRKYENTKTKFIYKLFRAKDKDKDQSYFLYTLTQEQLKHLLFPLGDYKKEEVRKLAKKFNLPTAAKRESQEICFIPGKSHNDFLKRYLKLKPGPIKLLPRLRLGEPLARFAKAPARRARRANPLPALPAGRLGRRGEGAERWDGVIGQHQGLPLYTIGQRKGVEIGGIGPFYVAKCDYKTNTLYVVHPVRKIQFSNGAGQRDIISNGAREALDPALYSDKLIADNVNWIAGKEPKLPFICEAVIRYRHKPTKCKVEKHENTKTPHYAKALRGRQKHKKQERYLVKFVEPQRAITPGQSVVFYGKDEVLGGGVISARGGSALG